MGVFFSAGTKQNFFYYPETHCSRNFKLLPARAAARCRDPALSCVGGNTPIHAIIHTKAPLLDTYFCHHNEDIFK